MSSAATAGARGRTFCAKFSMLISMMVLRYPVSVPGAPTMYTYDVVGIISSVVCHRHPEQSAGQCNTRGTLPLTYNAAAVVCSVACRARARATRNKAQ
eukprot:1169575-Prorocentrum_minimum.AAC.1